MLEPTLLASVLRALPVRPGAEVTVECNPDDVTSALIDALLDAGLTRVSLGVQSTVDHVLANIGRRHRRAEVGAAVAVLARSGVPSYNVDLIYGAANESLADWETTLRETVGFGTTPTVARPSVRSRATAPAVTTDPRVSTTSPGPMSSPTGRT